VEKLINVLLDYGILLPLLVGVYRYKSLPLPYRIFLFYHFLNAFMLNAEPGDSSIDTKIIFQYVWISVQSVLLMKILLIWSSFQLNRYYWIFVMVFLLALWTDYFLQWNVQIKKPVVHIINNLFFIFLCLQGIAKEFARHRLTKEVLSHLFILIPLLVGFVLFDFLQLLYMFFYTEFTKAIMIKTYRFYQGLLVLNYVFYSFAFLWAPRKENFL
jgi:hypothetical protein